MGSVGTVSGGKKQNTAKVAAVVERERQRGGHPRQLQSFFFNHTHRRVPQHCFSFT